VGVRVPSSAPKNQEPGIKSQIRDYFMVLVSSPWFLVLLFNKIIISINEHYQTEHRRIECSVEAAAE
jgi:hypothetical protein